MASEELKQKLSNIQQVFDVQDVLAIDGGKEHIQKYYKVNKLAYDLFNLSSRFIHFGISTGDTLKKSDLEEQAKFVHKNINAKTKRVLELACGRGENSIFLAKSNPNIEFVGVDISEGQLEYAIKRSNNFKNIHIFNSDYHNLKQFKDGSFQIVFIIEALCYSKDVNKVLREVYRLLEKGGLFIIYDGYVHRSHLDADEKSACQLAERGMAVDRFASYDEFKKGLKTTKFKIKYEDDLSQAILPTLRRFNKTASKFFTYPKLSRVFATFLPKLFLYNAISGYLMYTLAKEGVAQYHLTVLEK